MGRLRRLTRRVGFAYLSLLAVLPPGLLLAAEGAAKHEEPGIINLNVTLLIQAVNFLILIALLSRFLFSPLKKFLAERAEGIEKALAEAKGAREAAAKAQEEYRAQILATQREAAALREQAQRDVEAERQRLLKASRDEAQRLMEEAKAAIEAETKRARATLRVPGGGGAAAGPVPGRRRSEAAGRAIRAGTGGEELIAGSLAKRYAKALVDVAAASDDLEAIRQELAEFAGLLRVHRELRLFLANPSVLRRDKTRALDEVLASLRLRPLTTSFLRILLEAGRLPVLDNVLRAYQALVDERLGRVKAVVTAAVPLEADAQERLRQRLEQVVGKRVYLEVQQDPGILGGLIAQIGSLVYDGSLRTQLARLREQLVRG